MVGNNSFEKGMHHVVWQAFGDVEMLESQQRASVVDAICDRVVVGFISGQQCHIPVVSVLVSCNTVILMKLQ